MMAKRNTQSSYFLYLVIFLEAMFMLICGVYLVWMRIDRSDIIYNMDKLKKELNAKRVLQTKLEIEKESLMAPKVLRERATEFEMRRALRKQIRRLPAPEVKS